MTTKLPGTLPAETHQLGKGEKIGVGIGIAVAVLGVVGSVGLMLWLKRQRFLKAEVR